MNGDERGYQVVRPACTEDKCSMSAYNLTTRSIPVSINFNITHKVLFSPGGG